MLCHETCLPTCKHECICSCHKTGSVHIIPCCNPCPRCGLNVDIACEIDEHLAECHDDAEARSRLGSTLYRGN